MNKKSNVPDWMKKESERAEEFLKSGKKVNNPSASNDPKIRNQKVKRTVKGFFLRTDYHHLYDQFVASEKYKSGNKSPDLIEEAIRDLFDKYGFEYKKD